MTKLSVNINKIAVVRNSRGGNVPDLLAAALAIERFGADGITVHPRPDARHIRYDDVRDLKRSISTELNVEGNPIDSFCRLVDQVRPAQVTLVPDAPDALTSNAGWDTLVLTVGERLAGRSCTAISSNTKGPPGNRQSRGGERLLEKRADFANMPGKFLIKYKFAPQILANSEGLYYTDVYYLTEEAGKAPR